MSIKIYWRKLLESDFFTDEQDEWRGEIHMDEWYKYCRKIRHKYFKSGNKKDGCICL